MSTVILRFALAASFLSAMTGCTTTMALQARTEAPEHVPPMGLFASLTGCPPDTITVLETEKKIDVGAYFYYFKLRCKNHNFFCSFYRGPDYLINACHEAI